MYSLQKINDTIVSINVLSNYVCKFLSSIILRVMILGEKSLVKTFK